MTHTIARGEHREGGLLLPALLLAGLLALLVKSTVYVGGENARCYMR